MAPQPHVYVAGSDASPGVWISDGYAGDRPSAEGCDPVMDGHAAGRERRMAGRLIAARDAGAAVLLISEDLDEILTLSDVIRVISEGRLSPEFARGEKTPAELGQWMAGQGFDHAA